MSREAAWRIWQPTADKVRGWLLGREFEKAEAGLELLLEIKRVLIDAVTTEEAGMLGRIGRDFDDLRTWYWLQTREEDEPEFMTVRVLQVLAFGSPAAQHPIKKRKGKKQR